MPSDDTFFGSGEQNKTILKPSPGGHRAPDPAPPSPGSGVRASNAATNIGGVQASDVNVLLSAAAPLLALASELRENVSHPDPAGLFAHVSREINTFEGIARRAGATPEMVLASRYVLCTLLDEIVLSTPWGNQSGWSSRTLLVTFHNEGWGGEKFFVILDRILQEPHKNIDLLELQYACLALGFEGKMRVRDGGRNELDRVQSNLYAAIRSVRGDFETELSPNWRGVRDQRSPLARYVPLWVVASVALGLLGVIYFGLLLSLNSQSDPVALQIASLGQDIPKLVEREAYQPRDVLTLKDLLANEIQGGLLEVREEAGASTVVLKGDGLFASGSAAVRASSLPIMRVIGEALNQIPGQILVTGHTDNVPIRSIRFPSNWHLSKYRAEAVRDILAANLEPERLLAEARSDNEPLVPNTSAANRAQNRRVEITLFAAPGRQ